MAYRKIYLAVDCTDDAQRDAVQKICNEISNMRVLDATRIQSMYPFFRQHQNELQQIFSLVKDKGVKGLISMQGANLLSRLTKK